MGLEGRRRVETHFSLTRFVYGVKSLYEELVERPVARWIAGCRPDA